MPAVISTLGAHNLLATVLLCCISFPVFTIGVYYAYQIHRDINNTALHELNIKHTLREISHGAVLSLYNNSAMLIAEPLAIVVAGASGSLSEIEYIELSYVDGSVLTSAWAANTHKKDLDSALEITHPLFHDNKRIGQLTAYYRPVAFFKGLWPHLKLLTILFVLQVLAGLSILGLFVHFRVIKPMRKIGKAAETIAEGDLSQPFPRDASYELNEISRHLEETRLKAIGAKRSLEQLDT